VNIKLELPGEGYQKKVEENAGTEKKSLQKKRLLRKYASRQT
jgi:hypothetical protein